MKLRFRLLPDMEDRAMQGCNPSAYQDSIQKHEEGSQSRLSFFMLWGEKRR